MPVPRKNKYHEEKCIQVLPLTVIDFAFDELKRKTEMEKSCEYVYRNDRENGEFSLK